MKVIYYHCCNVILTVSFITCVFASVNSVFASTTIYADSFNQFAIGTDLTHATYTPDIGSENSANFTVFGTGSGSSKQAIDFGGSTSVFIDQPATTGSEYSGGLSTSYSTLISFSWDLTVLGVNSGLGGFFIRFPSPAFGMQILLGYLDDSRIGVFTDVPSTSTLMTIGTYIPNQTYSTRLDYNLLLDNYSVYVDGSVLLSGQMIPDYLDKTSVDRFGFDIAESLPGSMGNQFVLDNVTVTVVPEPISSTLFIVGGATLGLRQFRKKFWK